MLGDRARLRRVLDNLLGNVRSHTPPETPAHVRVSTLNGSAVLEVSDEGPGLADDDLARVFERFYRADTSRSRESGGVGLGLSIVAAIADAHHGKVSVAPRAGGRRDLPRRAAARLRGAEPTLRGAPLGRRSGLAPTLGASPAALRRDTARPRKRARLHGST